MVKLFSLKSPDEWATTKQACRDTYVVTCFLPSTIRNKYIYVLGRQGVKKQIQFNSSCLQLILIIGYSKKQ